MDFTDMKVLVIGDLCLDVLTNGESTRLSPEAPVPVIKNATSKFSLGMAGNVATNLKNLGADVYIESFYVKDKLYGDIINQLLFENGIKFNEYFINGNKAISNIIKNRIMANGHQVVRLDVEFGLEQIEDYAEEITKHIDSTYSANQFDFIVIADYNKGFITQKTWEAIYQSLNRINKGDFFVDTKKHDVLEYYEGMILFPNHKELKELMKYNNCLSVHEFRDLLDSNMLIETLSENGAIAYAEARDYTSNATKSEVIDVCGCGDTFVAAFSLFYTKFKNIQKALDFANFCCGKVVMKKGTTPITFEESVQFDYQN